MERHLNLNLNLSLSSSMTSANGALFRSACPATISGALSAMAMLDADSGQATDGKISEATPDCLPVNAKPGAAAPNPTGMLESQKSSVGERVAAKWQRLRAAI
jgi:hypothetical protein